MNKLQKEYEILYNEFNKRQAQKDCAFFVENFVYIEDRDAPGLAILFHLWDGQRKTLQAFMYNRLNIVLKARQLGLTWLSLAYAVWNIIFKPGYMVVALSKKDDDAKELVRRVGFILRHMPAWLIRYKKDAVGWSGLIWEDTTSQITVHYPNGEDAMFKSFTAAPDSGRSFTANLVILDEWAFQQWAREIWTAAYPTINRPTGGQLIGLSTMSRGTLFEDIWLASKEGSNTFNRIFLGWDTDPRRTQQWYKQTKKDLGDAILAEYPATEEEAFLIPGGSFFPELRSSIHIQPAINKPYWWRRYVSIDYGLDMLAAYWHCIDDKGNDRIYRELYKSNLIVSEAAREIKKANGKDKIYAYYAPPDLWNRNRDTGKSASNIFAEHGICLIRSSNQREQGWLNLKEWLQPYTAKDEQTGKEYVTAHMVIEERAAPNLWRCLINIQKDKNNPNDTSNEPHELTHAPDSIRYFASSRHCASTEPVGEPHYNFESEKPQHNEFYGQKIDRTYIDVDYGGW